MDSGDEDELTIGSRDFRKLMERVFRDAYVEVGAKVEEEAYEKFQPVGHENLDAFRLYIDVGRLKALAESSIVLLTESGQDNSESQGLAAFRDKLNSLMGSMGGSNDGSGPLFSELVSEFKTLYPDGGELAASFFKEEGRSDVTNGCSSCTCSSSDTDPRNPASLPMHMDKLSF